MKFTSKAILGLMFLPAISFAAPVEYNCKGIAAGYQEVKVVLETESRPKVELTGTLNFVSKEMTEKTKDHLYPSEIKLGAKTFMGLYLEKDQNNQDVVASFFLETWPVGENVLLITFGFGDEASYGRDLRVTDIQSTRFEPQFFCEKIPAPEKKPIWQFVFRIE